MQAQSAVSTRTRAKELLNETFESAPSGERIRFCLQCGSCSGSCPNGSAMDFPPHAVIASLRAGEIGPFAESDSIWLCMSCYACTSSCPAKIPLTDGILAKIKEERLLQGKLPAELKEALENARRYGNTLGESPKRRAEWTEDFTVEVPIMARHKRPVEVLWYVGDYASYHPRVQRTTRALAKILHALNISFGILGPEENSDGDVFYLAGERGLFELLARKNMRALAKYEFGELITTDPHAYNSFTHAYPQLGYQPKIRHVTQFLADRIDDLGTRLKPIAKRVTYHDPCALGRANGNSIYDEPRKLLESIPDLELVEMSHSRETSLCCGGGGGGMWLDGFSYEHSHTRISEWRVREALHTEAQILAVACPYETPRFEDAAKSLDCDGDIEVMDVAELLAMSMEL